VDRLAGADAGVRQASPPSFQNGNAYFDRLLCCALSVNVDRRAVFIVTSEMM
jgi:hypothetical protein